MPLQLTAYALEDGTTLHVIHLNDRRAAGAPMTKWLLQNQVERCLFGAAGNAACWRALQRLSMQSCPLSLKRASVPTLVTDEEYKELIRLLESTLDLDARGRCRAVTVLPVPVSVALAKSVGRSKATTAFLTALNEPVPRAWELAQESEDLRAQQRVDLLVEEELAEEEEWEAPLHAELLHTHVACEETEEERATIATLPKLARVPAGLEAQLRAYKDWRLCPLNYQRQGNAVVDVTAEHDCATVLRFLAYAQQEHGVSEPSLALFGSARLADVAQAWLEQMRARGLLYSTLANYTNSLCNVVAHWWDSEGAIEEAALQLDPQPPSALLRLRAQCEAQSKQQQLYAKKPANWLDWDKAQEARVKCAEAWSKARTLSHDAKVALLKEYLVLLFHTVMPPDRVGIVRKLRWNATLKRDAPGAYRLDMTQARFKNSRFYGPSVTSVSSMIAPALDAYVSLIAFEMEDAPYVFCMKRDATRCQTSSQWSAYCKDIFKKWSGVACPPKMLVRMCHRWELRTPDVLMRVARIARSARPLSPGSAIKTRRPRYSSRPRAR